MSEVKLQDILSVGFFNRDLCTRCGTCGGICPTGAIEVREDFYPSLIAEKCTACGLCAKVCPGGSVDFNVLSQRLFGSEFKNEKYTGRYLEAYIGHSTDDDIRSGASSGGVVTQLLVHLLETGSIKGAIVVAMDEENPLVGKAYIARNRQELMPSRQSKYTIVPVNRVLAEIREDEGPYALVGLPCHVHGFRKWANLNRKLEKIVPIVIGLYCVTNLEPVVTADLLKIAGLTNSHVTGFEFRGGEWPGQIRARDENGKYHALHYSNFKDGAINYLTRLYSPTRCKLCTDGSAEFADISVADGWTRGNNGKYLYHRMSTILVRTEQGRKILKSAVDSGVLFVQSIDHDSIYRTHIGLQKQKKRDAPARIERLRRKGRIVPEYNMRWEGTLSDSLHERFSSLVMLLGKFPFLRFMVLKLLLSKAALPLLWIRQWRKNRKTAV